MDRSARRAGAFGIAAAVVYVAATAAGSVLDPSYSQVRQHVSDLTASGASTWAALAPAYLLYNALCLAFAVALYRSSSRTRLFKVGLGLLVLNAFAGVMMVTWFREDPGRVVTTASGAGHIAFASVSSLTIVLGSIVYGFAFGRSPVWRGLSAFSFAVGAAMIAFSPIAIAAINSPLAGLAERGAIGVFLVWLIGVGGYLLNHSPGRRTVVA